MERQEINIAGHSITQVDETEYECENENQKLDFHFDAGHPDAVEVFVFDSDIPTHGEQDPCITAFYAESLEDAVIKAMSIQRDSLMQLASSGNSVMVKLLRGISNKLSANPNSDTETVLFPCWDAEYEGER